MNKIHAWKSIIFAMAFTFSGILLWNQSGFGVPTPKNQNIVVHLSQSTSDLHRTSMALDLAIALQRAGTNVTLFLDLEGVRIMDKNLPQNLTWGFGSLKFSIQKLLQNYIEAGGQVLLCPHCIQAAGLSESSLMSEAKIAESPEEVARLFIDADKIIDY